MPSRNERAISRLAKQLDGRINAFRLSWKDVKVITSELLEGLDTPTSLGLWIALQADDLRTVVSHEVRPIDFLEEDVDLFRRSYQATSFLRKMAFSVDGFDPSTTAYEDFHKYERLCKEANRNLKKYRSDPLSVDHRIHVILHYMIRDISATLGGFSPSTWVLASTFGPGAAVGATGSDVYDKIGTNPCVTEGFARLGAALVNSSPAWVDAVRNRSDDFSDTMSERELLSVADLDICPGGRYCRVPKNAKTDRNIEVQPSLNVYAQLGLGKMISQRLRMDGHDLRTQEAKNKTLAKLGSQNGVFATIDLSAASDTICIELVRELIPPRWLHAMELCRTTHCTLPDGTLHRLSRWSSMGNGYTFELETLIFRSLVRACRRHLGDTYDYAIFGDDIICSTRVAKLVMEMLPLLGFSLNEKKSFLSSLFRESCGGDFFNGINVRPYFFKKGADSANLQATISLANGLRRASSRSNNHYGCDCRFKRAWVCVLQRIPRDLRKLLIGPWSDSDLWIITDEPDWQRDSSIFLDRRTWSWKMPSLISTQSDRSVNSYTSAKAAMLYHLEKRSLTWQGDELTLRTKAVPRESSLYGLPNLYSIRQKLDVTYVELSPALHLWV